MSAMTETRVPDWVRMFAAATPDAPAVTTADATISYGELDRRVAEAASGLTARRVGPGSLVDVPAEPGADVVALLAAVPRVGATIHASGHDHPIPDAVPPDTYAIVATSGSAGRARSVILSHGNVIAAVGSSQARLGNDASDRWLLCLPLTHVAGLFVAWRSFAAGGSMVVHRSFDAARVAATLKHGDATFASLVPTMLHRILSADSGPYQGVRAVLLGGAPARADLVERALDAGLPILQTYGMTETGSQIATVEPGEARSALGTAGRPLDGMVVTTDEGEILVDGPAVSPGYLGEPRRTGPFRTGDLGHFDTAGRLVVVGRKGGVIITGGENVHPAKVEAALESHPAVDVAVVFGVEEEEWGEVVAAVISAPVAAVASVAAHAERRLARHEMPKRWVAVDAMPLLANGKPDRAAAERLLRDAGSDG